MESTLLLTSTLKTAPTCNQVCFGSPSYFVPSQLTPLRVKTTCHLEVRGSNRKNMQSVFSSGGGGNSGSVGEDVIILNVGGMMCGGCADSVKRILETQPQVSSASVELTTETAIVCPVSEVKDTANWQQQLGEALAKHLTTCGFTSSVQAEGLSETTSPPWWGLGGAIEGIFHLEMQKISSNEQPVSLMVRCQQLVLVDLLKT